MKLKNSGLNGIQTFASLILVGNYTNNGVTKLHVGNKANLRGFSLVKESFFSVSGACNWLPSLSSNNY